MLRTSIILAAVATTAIVFPTSRAVAQSVATQNSSWEFLVSSGKLVPTGAQRSALQTGDHTAAQLAYFFTPRVALTSTLSWTRSHDLSTPTTPYLNVFMLDVGAEARAVSWSDSAGVKVSPFAGAGVGARRYSADAVIASARHNMAGYLSAGGEVGTRRVRVRLEARDYVSGFRAFDGGSATVARNDVVMMAGLRIGR